MPGGLLLVSDDTRQGKRRLRGARGNRCEKQDEKNATWASRDLAGDGTSLESEGSGGRARRNDQRSRDPLALNQATTHHVPQLIAGITNTLGSKPWIHDFADCCFYLQITLIWLICQVHSLRLSPDK